MMQFTQSAPPPPPPLLHPNGLGLGLHLDLDLDLDLDLVAPDQAPPLLLYSQRAAAARPPWPGRSAVAFPTSSRALGSFNTAGCMEQLLVHCANAIDGNDATLAQQILWVLNNIASPDGDSNQRLTSAFLRALVARASVTGSCKILTAPESGPPAPASHHQFSALELASFIDLTPWYRFGYTASNAAILDAVEGSSVVHIVDLSTTHCMQIPTLIDALASRPEGPPLLRLTVPSITANSPPPVLDISYNELGSRLVNFARLRNIPMEFQEVPSSPADGFSTLIDQLRVQQLVSDGGEALVVNCQMLLHYIPDESAGAISTQPVSLRSTFLKAVRSLEPALVTIVDEDADFTATDVVSRLRSAFNYLWIPYDAVDTFLSKESEQRKWYEAGLGWRIEDVIAREGVQRVERLEPRGRWAQRMRGAGFRGAAFGEEAAAEVKGMLDEHAAGWGMKREEDGDLVLTWKGHNVVFATAWVPS